jgi:hypothetical protein
MPCGLAESPEDKGSIFLGMLISTYKAIQHYNPEDQY